MSFDTTPSLDESPILESQVRNLRRWYFIYLSCWLGGIVLSYVIGGEVASMIAIFLIFGSIIPYIICIVHAYKVQANLKKAGLVKSGAWQIVVAALLFTPFVVGFYVPLSVLLEVRSIRKKLSLNSTQP